jgi:hypothetical protein
LHEHGAVAHFAFLQSFEDAVQIPEGIGLQPGLHFPVGHKMKDVDDISRIVLSGTDDRGLFKVDLCTAVEPHRLT